VYFLPRKDLLKVVNEAGTRTPGYLQQHPLECNSLDFFSQNYHRAKSTVKVYISVFLFITVRFSRDKRHLFGTLCDAYTIAD
jgi:hypothetical protein